MIRPATESDIPALVEMGRRFFDASGYEDITEYDPETVTRTFHLLMNGGVLLVVDSDGVVGAAGAMVYPFYFNAAHMTGQELFWWVDPEYRGVGNDLRKALETAVQEKGAKSFSMIALERLNPELVGALYRRAGYRASEHSYIKRF